MYRILIPLLLLLGCKSSGPEQAVLDSAEYATLNGFTFFIRQVGAGVPVLVCHGGPGLDHTYLMPQMGRLAKDARLIFYDQRACGLSGHIVDSSMMRLDTFLNDMEAIRMHLGLERMAVLGHSFGGFLAMAYAAKYPDRISHLILMNSMPPTYTLWQQNNDALFNRITPAQRQEITTVQQSDAYMLGEAKGYEELFRVMYKLQFADPERIDSLTMTLQPDFETTSQTFNAMMPDLINYDYTGQLKKLKAPVLVIYGDHEPGVDRTIQTFQEINSSWKLVKLPDCGHFPYIEAFPELERAIASFTKQ